jgi:uncharacterized membrane protein
MSGGLGITALGIGATINFATKTELGLIGLSIIPIGIVLIAASGKEPGRTPTGTAALAQTQGFRLYLETAKADQLRFEEGEDLFSRYLPFAVAFGLTGRWTRAFAQLAARDVQLSVPTWYIGTHDHDNFWTSADALERNLAGFTRLASSAVSAPTPRPSGTSGFSGGGYSGGRGRSGGGVSGGGGGSW